jgi:hypothetical protein
MKKAVVIGILLVSLVIYVCFVWFSTPEPVSKTTNNTGLEIAETEVLGNSNPATTTTTGAGGPDSLESGSLRVIEEEPSLESEKPTEPITFDVTSLPEGQQSLLRTLGITEEIITVTPAMEACVVGKVGAERLQAIVAGDTPSFFEGLALVNCYE